MGCFFLSYFRSDLHIDKQTPDPGDNDLAGEFGPEKHNGYSSVVYILRSI